MDAVRTTCTPRSTSRSCCSATWPRCTSLELVTGVIILPQRQTALVAKQAAEVDLLTERPVPTRRRASAGTPSSTRRSGKRSTTRGQRHERADRAAAPARGPRQPSPTTASSTRVTAAGLAPLPRAATDPDLDRRPVAAGVPTHRPTGRRLVPAGAAGADARRGPWPSSTPRPPRPAAIPATHRHGGSRQLDRRRHRASSSTRSAGGATPVPSHLSINTMNAGLGAGRTPPRGAGDGRRRARVVPAQLTLGHHGPPCSRPSRPDSGPRRPSPSPPT